MVSRILIKHLAGSKAHQIEQFRLEETNQLLIGRGIAADVAFDGQLDDGVSRRHALIRITRGHALTITDLGSKNGIRVNGKSVTDEQVFRPGDLIELSPAGPAFQVAFEPDFPQVADMAMPKIAELPNSSHGHKNAAMWALAVVVVLLVVIVTKTLIRGAARPAVATSLSAPETRTSDIQAFKAQPNETRSLSVATAPAQR